MRGYIPPQNVEETIFAKQAANLMQRVEDSGTTAYSLFLDLRQQQLFFAQKNKFSSLNISYEYGFLGDGERCIAAISLSSVDINSTDIPIAILSSKIQSEILTHRDFLGAAMSLKIIREYIGDIVVKSNFAYMAVHKNIAEIIVDELKSVNKTAVNFNICQEKPLYENLYENIKTSTVASLRADAIITAVLNVSRNNASNIIKQGNVKINHLQIFNTDFAMFDKDIISIKGHGKYKILCDGGKSRKDRIFIKIVKY